MDASARHIRQHVATVLPVARRKDIRAGSPQLLSKRTVILTSVLATIETQFKGTLLLRSRHIGVGRASRPPLNPGTPVIIILIVKQEWRHLRPAADTTLTIGRVGSGRAGPRSICIPGQVQGGFPTGRCMHMSCWLIREHILAVLAASTGEGVGAGALATSRLPLSSTRRIFTPGKADRRYTTWWSARACRGNWLLRATERQHSACSPVRAKGGGESALTSAC